MKVTFLLKQANADYDTWIICVCCYDAKRVRVYTDLKINPKFWDATTQRIKTTKTYPTNPEKNQRLQAIADYAVKIEDQWKLKSCYCWYVIEYRYPFEIKGC